MSDDLDDLAAAGGSEWGLGSMVLGGVLTVAGPVTQLLIRDLQTSWYRGSAGEAVAGYLIGAMLLGLAALGVLFGLWGMAAARRRGRPPALGLVGFLLNAFALFLWTGIGLSWHSTGSQWF